MSNLLIDHTFIEAILQKKHPQHEIAEKLSKHIGDNDRLYLPDFELVLLLDKISEYPEESKEIIRMINEITRIDCFQSKNVYYKAFDEFKQHENLTFLNCLTKQYMKHKGLKYILSFNEKYDKIQEIKRIYKMDEINPKRLNYDS